MKKYKCFYCGLKHPKVECKGVFHCPNALCDGPGAAFFRSTLDSYVDHGSTHTVDEDERLKKGKAHNKKNKIKVSNISNDNFK